jgi:DNA-binding transcriptional MerR regulator
MQNISENFTLTTKQTRVIGYLLTCRTTGEAAKKAGVSERTIFTWMKQECFRKALQEESREIINSASRRLIQGQKEALDTLSSLMVRGRNEGVRRAAAVDWLNFMLKYHDLNEVEERLKKLENAVENAEK